MLEQAIAEVQRSTTEVVRTLIRNLTSGQPSSEVRAAHVMLELAFKGVERLESEERLTALETAVRAVQPSGHSVVTRRFDAGPDPGDRQ